MECLIAYVSAQVGSGAWVAGIDCDVTSPASVERLRDAAASQLGTVDIWINNAGCSGGFKASPGLFTACLLTFLLLQS